MGLDINGEVWVWGNNDYGQLAQGAGPSSPMPTIIDFNFGKTGNSNRYIVKIAAGARHALALDNEGNVWVWGDNSYGQLGLGTLGGDHSRPEEVKTLNLGSSGVKIVSIYALDNSSYIVDGKGTLYAFGGGENFMKQGDVMTEGYGSEIGRAHV